MNSIYNNNYNSPLIYYVTQGTPQNGILDVTRNYWGTDFNPEEDLSPTEAYIYLPVWEPGWGGYKNSNSDEDIFKQALQYLEDSNFIDAESNFLEIIEDYPESKYVGPSIKEMFVLKEIHDQDFEGYKNYLDNLTIYENDTLINRIIEHVSTWCNIKLEEYINAINWFESQIEDPPCFEDSIFAIIDLGNTYFLMNDSTSNRFGGYIGSLPQYYHSSFSSYEKFRDYHIDLLFRETEHFEPIYNNNEVQETLFTKLLPNPFSSSIRIDYSVPFSSNVSIKIYNPMGKLLTILKDSYHQKGKSSVIWNPQSIDKGIYFITYEINNNILDTEKIIYIK